MSRAVRLTLPFPPAGLSPNARLHWRAKAEEVAQYRADCGWAGALAEMPDDGKPYDIPYRRLEPPVEATVTFVVPDRRKRDEQNFLQMLKPAFDGLVDAGVLTDDNHEVFKVVSTSFVVGEPKVIVELVSRAGAGQ